MTKYANARIKAKQRTNTAIAMILAASASVLVMAALSVINGYV